MGHSVPSHSAAGIQNLHLSPHPKDQALSPPSMKRKKRIILPVSVCALKVVFDVPVVMVMLAFIVYCDM